MKQYPSIPRADEAPADLLDSGHLWIQEKVDGEYFRFRLRESGMLQFGDRNRVYRDPDEIPLRYRHAVRHVRERFDREALRNSVADVASVVFFGVATHRRAIDYDWDRLPSFLGFDVWDAGGDDGDRSEDDDGRFLPPDAAEQIHDRLGLDPVNALQKEVRAIDFDPRSYEVPDSAWYDGPAAGVVLRNKTGQRATIPNPDFEEADGRPARERGEEDDAPPADATAEDLARAYATRDRVESVASELESRGRAPTFDAVYERVVENVVRENRLFRDDDRSTDPQAFRSAVAERTQELLET